MNTYLQVTATILLLYSVPYNVSTSADTMNLCMKHVARIRFYFNSPVVRHPVLKMEKIMHNNQVISQLITSLQHEIAAVEERLASQRLAELERENEQLRKDVADHINQLNAIEIAAGRKQIPVPNNNKSLAGVVSQPAVTAQASTQPASKTAPLAVSNDQPAKPAPQNKETKAPKPKKEKAANQPGGKAAEPEAPVDISRLDLRIGKIIEVSKHPDADALYLEKIDCGEPQPRTVISGLVKFVPIEEMQNRVVVVLCNLKPVKMRGITSEAMVMCASTPEKVEVLIPPAAAIPGDLVSCEGYPRTPDDQLNPKKKVLETVLPDLKTNDNLEATYKGAKLVVGDKGIIITSSLKNVSIK